MSAEYGSSAVQDKVGYNTLRGGKIVGRRLTSAGPQVQVTYEDRDGVVTDWLPVIQQGAAGVVFHYCPRVGDNVLVAHFPTGIESGVVLGATPSSVNPGITPRSLDSIAMQADDGSYFEYEPNAGCLSMAGISTLYLQANGDAEIDPGGKLTINVGGTTMIISGGNMTISGPTITLQGNVVITGTLDVKQFTTLEVGGATLTGHVANADGAGGGS
jgi:phage baseplate assembly protein V